MWSRQSSVAAQSADSPLPVLTADAGADGRSTVATASRFSLGNRPSLTGLRAFFVAPIVIFHLNFQTMPDSWVAVNGFFVRSGFLITSMLANEHSRLGRISLGKFYSRRATWLLPPLLLTVLLYAFDTRGDAVFFGCLLCLIATGSHLDNWGKRAKQLLALAAVVSSAVMVWIVFEVGTYARSMPLIWITVSEIASLVIIAYFVVHPAGTGTKAMGISILVLVGNMSYTIYLIHWPVFTALSPTTTLWPSWLLDIVRLLIVGAIAVFSWYVIEKPLTRWRRRELAPVVAQPS